MKELMYTTYSLRLLIHEEKQNKNIKVINIIINYYNFLNVFTNE